MDKHDVANRPAYRRNGPLGHALIVVEQGQVGRRAPWQMAAQAIGLEQRDKGMLEVLQASGTVAGHAHH